MKLEDAIMYAFKKTGKSELSADEIRDNIREFSDFQDTPDVVLKKKILSILNRKSKSKNPSFVKAINAKTKRHKKGTYTLAKEKKQVPLIKPDKVKKTNGIKKLDVAVPGLFDNNVPPRTPVTTNTAKGEYSNTGGFDSSFFGKAGEYAVVSELLLRGYKAGIMSVDDGIDVYASNGDKFFLIQVKATWFANDKINTAIKMDRFEKNNSSNVFYIIVFRYQSRGAFINRYLIFKSSDIDRFVNIGAASIGVAGNINIKIKQSGALLYMYNNQKEEEINYYLDNFGLLK